MFVNSLSSGKSFEVLPAELIYPENLVSSKVLAFFSKKLPINFSFEKFKPEGFKVFLPRQVHSAKVVEVNTPSVFRIEADAGFTTKKGLLIGVLTADCLPVLFKSETLRNRLIVGAIHAGWRGSVKKILFRTLKQVFTEKKGLPEKTYIAFGPHIKSCCYQVKEDVLEEIEKSFGKVEPFVEKRGNLYFLSLLKLNLFQLKELGIPEENIWISPECTFCKAEEYWSYRKHGKNRGSQISLVGIKEC